MRARGPGVQHTHVEFAFERAAHAPPQVEGLGTKDPSLGGWEHQNSTKGPQERDDRVKIVAGEEKKSAKIWASPPSGVPLLGGSWSISANFWILNFKIKKEKKRKRRQK